MDAESANENIMRLEGPFLWMEMILTDIPNLADLSAKSKFVQEKIVKRELESVGEWRMSNWTAFSKNKKQGQCVTVIRQSYGYPNPKLACLFAVQICKAALLAYIGEFADACEIIALLRDMLPFLTHEHARLSAVAKYHLDILEWCIYLKKNNCADVRSITKEIEQFHANYASFQTDMGAQAFDYYIKQNIKWELLDCSDEEKMKVYDKVTAMDGDYHVWHYLASKKHRTLRTKKERIERTICYPSEEEFKYLKTAYELSPCCADSLFGVAILLKDVLKREVNYLPPYLRIHCWFSKGKEATKKRCLRYINKALELALENGLKKWSIWIEFQKADFFLHHGDRQEGIRMLHRLVKDYPGFHFAHQKLGKAYLEGDSKSDAEAVRKARHHITLALNLQKYQHFDTVYDYLKVFRSSLHPLPIGEVLSVLTKSLQKSESTWSPRQVSDFLIARGCILWIYGSGDGHASKRRACEDWLYVLKTSREHKNLVFKAIQRPSYYVYKQGLRRAEIRTEEVRRHLLDIRNSCCRTNYKNFEAIEFFLENFEHKNSINLDWRSNHGRHLGHMFEQQLRMGEADRVNSWRD